MLEQHPGRNPVKEIHRQFHQMSKGFGRRGNVDLVGGKKQQITADVTYQRIEYHGYNDPDSDNIERIVRLIDQYFIHYDLEEKRNYQRKNRQQYHHQSDLTENPLVFEKFRNKPAQTERLIFIRKFVNLFQQNEFFTELLIKLQLAEKTEMIRHIVLIGFRIENHRISFTIFMVAKSAENRIFTAGFHRYQRQNRRTFLQIFPRHIEFFHFEVVIGSDLGKQIFPHFILSDGIFVHDFPDIRRSIVVPCDLHKGCQTGLFFHIHLRQIAEYVMTLLTDVYSVDSWRSGSNLYFC